MFNSSLFQNETIYKIDGERIIYINGLIDNKVAMAFNIILLKLEAENPDEEISLYINSPGGDLSSTLSMIDTMSLISCPISTICVGLAASSAALLLLSGTKGKRKALKNGIVMLHQPLNGFHEGFIKASDLQIISDNLLKTQATVYKLISDATDVEIEQIKKDCEKDFYLNANQALEYGIIDTILLRS